MKKKLLNPLHLFFLIFSFNSFLAQDLSLKISSINYEERKILKKIEFKNKHEDSLSLYLELNKVKSFLKKNGYFMNTIDSIKKINKNFTGYFSLRDKVNRAIITIDPNFSFLFKDLESNIIDLPIKNVQLTLSNISKKLDEQGKSFSKVQLKNIVIKNNNLFAELDVYQSKKRRFDKIIVKGYEKFPKNYIKNHFNINKNTIFNQLKIKEISNSSKNIEFIEEIKKPEILFTKDSTLLYLYFKKKQKNSFDGIVNFTSKEDGGVLFNGNLDIKFNNIFNKGEKFRLFWNSIGEERQEFELSSKIAYIFNSKFTPKVSFSIYRQDSTFLNTKFNSDLFYKINSKVKIALSYNSESSENLGGISNNTETFQNYFLGVKLQYKKPKNDFFLNDIFSFEINPTLGKRQTKDKLSNQLKIEALVSYLWDINYRTSIYVKNKTGYLNSNSYLDNELFRIGGANSIRGFNEQSIFTNNFTYFNTEYRYSTSKKSFLYSISDIGIVNSKILLGLGIGYTLTNKNSLINISIATGKEDNNKFQFNNSKFIISWINYF